MHKDYQAISIKRATYDKLKKAAAKEKRSMGNLIEVLLELKENK